MKLTKSIVLSGCFLLLVFSLDGRTNAELISFGSGGNQFNMDFVEIGHTPNDADTTGAPNPAGSVGYTYSIGTYEVSRDMVTKASTAGSLGISLDSMSFVTGGALRDMPATGTSWNEAARFVNWLNIDQGFSPAYKFSTQPGDGGYSSNENILLWDSGDAGYDASNEFRNSLAAYVLPTTDEWYKAAYYDPDANTGTGGYWNYATGSDTAPTATTGSTTAGEAVYNQSSSQGPADIDDAGGLSPLGTMGQSGNVYEWEESTVDQSNDSGSSSRGLRGGAWDSDSFFLRSSTRLDFNPTIEGLGIGFRVASLSSAAVPEPSSLVLTMIASAFGLGYRSRRRRR